MTAAFNTRQNPRLAELDHAALVSGLTEGCHRIRVGSAGYRPTDVEIHYCDHDSRFLHVKARVANVPVLAKLNIQQSRRECERLRDLIDQVSAQYDEELTKREADEGVTAEASTMLRLAAVNGEISAPLAGDNFTALDGKTDPRVTGGSVIGGAALDAARTMGDLLNASAETTGFSLLVAAVAQYRSIYPTMDPEKFATNMGRHVREAVDRYMHHGCGEAIKPDAT